MGGDEIESLMKARADMKMLHLKQKFITTMFKPDTGKLSVKRQKERFLINFNKEFDKANPNDIDDYDND